MVVPVKATIGFLFAAALEDLLASLVIHEVDVAFITFPPAFVVVLVEHSLVIEVPVQIVPVAAVGSASSTMAPAA